MRRKRCAHTSSEVLKLMYQVESVMAKLGIERRVQYGAEKMLDVSRLLAKYESCKLTCLQVIEQQSGLDTGGMKEKITAQLESAANKIRELEEKLERLRGGEY
jgi:rapamycin-insensitive companion of mTOR